MSLIVDTAINDPPYFDPPLDDSFPVQIQLTQSSESWELKLPSVLDPEGRQVTVTAILNQAKFIDFSESAMKLTIDDLSDSSINSGFYEIQFILQDDKNILTESAVIDVRDPVLSQESEPEEETEIIEQESTEIIEQESTEDSTDSETQTEETTT